MESQRFFHETSSFLQKTLGPGIAIDNPDIPSRNAAQRLIPPDVAIEIVLAAAANWSCSWSISDQSTWLPRFGTID